MVYSSPGQRPRTVLALSAPSTQSPGPAPSCGSQRLADEEAAASLQLVSSQYSSKRSVTSALAVHALQSGGGGLGGLGGGGGPGGTIIAGRKRAVCSIISSIWFSVKPEVR